MPSAHNTGVSRARRQPSVNDCASPAGGANKDLANPTHHPPTLLPAGQGASCTPVFNFVLRKAAEGRQFDAVVALLSAMRASGLEVDPGVAALVRGMSCQWVWGVVSPGFRGRMPACGMPLRKPQVEDSRQANDSQLYSAAHRSLLPLPSCR